MGLRQAELRCHNARRVSDESHNHHLWRRQERRYSPADSGNAQTVEEGGLAASLGIDQIS